MKQIITGLVFFITLFSFSQEEDKAQLLAAKKANDFVYEGNNLAEKEDFVTAEMAYRKAISEQSSSAIGNYNLANSYIKSDNLEEALFRLDEAAKKATSKDEKHKIYHNIGNVLMQNEKCEGAVEAYKNALRNNPSDEETRYNLAAAKDCAEKQKDDKQDDDKEDKQDKDDKNKEQEDKKDQEDQNKDDKQDKGNEDKKEGDDKKDDEGKPKDDKKNENKGDNDKKEEDKGQPKPQPGQLSPQQIKSLLEAMNNQEQDVQDKINAEKQKGQKIKTDKDW